MELADHIDPISFISSATTDVLTFSAGEIHKALLNFQGSDIIPISDGGSTTNTTTPTTPTTPTDPAVDPNPKPDDQSGGEKTNNDQGAPEPEEVVAEEPFYKVFGADYIRIIFLVVAVGSAELTLMFIFALYEFLKFYF